MTPEQKERFEFYAYHKENSKIYPVVSLGVFGTLRKHTLLDIYSPEVNNGDTPFLEVTDNDVEIIEPTEIIENQNKLFQQLGKMVIEIDWVKIGKILENDKNYDGAGWEHLAKAWRDRKNFAVFHYFYNRFNKKYHWLEFLNETSLNDQESISILKYLENCNPLTPTETMLQWRGIEDEKEVCPECDGSGVKTYPNTTTWKGGFGGQALTKDVCNKCWGSGNSFKPWVDLSDLFQN
jgi:hypothetical protein